MRQRQQAHRLCANEKKIRVFYTSNFFTHTSFPLEKVHTRSQTVARSGKEVLLTLNNVNSSGAVLK